MSADSFGSDTGEAVEVPGTAHGDKQSQIGPERGHPVLASLPNGGLAPVPLKERIHVLDVLRGFALLGICMVNMQFFAMPLMQAVVPVTADQPASEQVAWAFVRLLFEYKFVSLFSLLFGIGFSVQLMRARARGGPFVPLYLRRLGVLFCIGLVHAILVWYGDILLMYSVIALCLLATMTWRAGNLIIAATVVLLLASLLMVGLTALQMVGRLMASDPAAEVQVEAAPSEATGKLELKRFADLSPSEWNPSGDEWMEVETAAFKHGPFLEALLVRAMCYGNCLLYSLFGFGWHILAMFLLGAGLMKLNFFRVDFFRWHVALATVALPLGLAMEGMDVWATWNASAVAGWLEPILGGMQEIGSVVLCLGYVGLWCVIVDRELFRWLTSAMARMGRMALTNYLMQTLIATFIMYWWGLGKFGEVSRVDQVYLAATIYVAQMLFSTVWLKYLSIGPMEWLWRSLAYLQIQPMFRPRATA